MHEDLISVIVPVYNVEKYLEKCLKSIISQTYQNLEIIIVDDGSLDKSFDICNKYCEMDNRIKLIRKENGGLASARNAALKILKGKYVVCVDSDDWIDKRMIEILHTNLTENDADLSVCDFYISTNNNYKYSKKSKEKYILDRNMAMEYAILPSKYYGFAWNKMYKKSIIDKQLYNEIFLKGEDSPFTCEYINKCSKVVYENKPLYFYRCDSISISRSKFNIGKMSVLDSYMSIIVMLRKNNYPSYLIMLQQEQYANQLLSLLVNIIKTDRAHFKKEQKIIIDQMGQYLFAYCKSKNIDLLHKIMYIILFGFTYFFKQKGG